MSLPFEMAVIMSELQGGKGPNVLDFSGRRGASVQGLVVCREGPCSAGHAGHAVCRGGVDTERVLDNICSC